MRFYTQPTDTTAVRLRPGENPPVARASCQDLLPNALVLSVGCTGPLRVATKIMPVRSSAGLASHLFDCAGLQGRERCEEIGDQGQKIGEAV